MPVDAIIQLTALKVKKMDKLQNIIEANNRKLHEFANRRDNLTDDEILKYYKLISENKELLDLYKKTLEHIRQQIALLKNQMEMEEESNG